MQIFSKPPCGPRRLDDENSTKVVCGTANISVNGVEVVFPVSLPVSLRKRLSPVIRLGIGLFLRAAAGVHSGTRLWYVGRVGQLPGFLDSAHSTVDFCRWEVFQLMNLSQSS